MNKSIIAVLTLVASIFIVSCANPAPSVPPYHPGPDMGAPQGNK